MSARTPVCRRAALLAAAGLLAGGSACGSRAFAADSPALDPACVMRLAETGADSMTISEMRDQCRLDPGMAGDGTAPEPLPPGDGERPVSPVEKRLADEREAAERPFSIMAHRPNYFLAAAWNEQGWVNVADTPDSDAAAGEYRDIESQFQLSVKVPLAIGLFGDRMDLYGAYTGRSFWQVYDRENSERFRETNHEPEVWAQFTNDWSVFGFTNSANSVGVVHQSNGQDGAQSRSWNRIFATAVFERGNWAVAIKPWVWISADRAQSDNPDIDDYLGYGEFRAVYGRQGHVFSGMLRNQLESGFDRGALELSWSFPVFDYRYLRGYVQYFYGYGESLIDYDRKVNRLGIGISVTDWLQ